MPAVLGLALGTAFTCGVAAEATIAGDLSARGVIRSSSLLQRTVQVTWPGPVSPVVDRRARALLGSLGLRSPTRVMLLNPVRLGGVVVRAVAIAPLPRWVAGAPAVSLGRCTEGSCPMVRLSAPFHRRRLDAYGVHLEVVGAAALTSPVPLGFAPAISGGPPVLVSGDPAGLDSIPGLSGLYRTQGWLSVAPVTALQSWQLAGAQARLQRAQAALQQSNSQFTLSGPFAVLSQARAQAAAAPSRLLPAGGGALAALSVFVILAAYGLRRDRSDDVRRLSVAGARRSQLLMFALAESAALSTVALVTGVALGVTATALLASAARLPAIGILSHSLFTSAGVTALIGGWLASTAVIALVLLLPGGRVADVLAIAAVAALALTLTGEANAAGPLPVLLAPLACVSAGVLVYRIAAALLRGGERIARRGPPLVRLALISLTRAPVAPSLSIAFIAVSIGLAGFALGYRATLLRGAADQAADRVPLDALVAANASFRTPLGLAPIDRWQALARGRVLTVRRTEATFVDGASSVTVPALGVPAAGLPLIRGWRASDASAPLGRLARRLRPPGPVRTRGPLTGRAARWLSLRMSARLGGVEVSADLRDPAGIVSRLALGAAMTRPRTVQVRLPRGRFELEALELDQPTGLLITNGHQNGENQTAATQSTTPVSLGPLDVLGAKRERLQTVAIGSWRGTGATSGPGRSVAGRGGGRVLQISFSGTGSPGVIRPLQPSDSRPMPVLVDPGTASAAASGGRIALSVDGLPIACVIVGVLRRFPTLATNGAGFVVADEATLAGALDASLPGQGRPDELWIDSPRPTELRAALRTGPLSSLSATFRQDVERGLRSDPIARGVLGTLLAAGAIAVALALIGLLVALLSTIRDVRVERELAIHGLGPRALRRELQLRILLAATLGLLAGLVISAALTRLAVAAVRGALTLGPPRPPLTTVAPWGELALLGLGSLVAFGVASWITTASTVGRGGER